MQRKPLLQVITLTADFEFTIKTSKRKSLLKRKLIDLLAKRKSSITKHLRLLKHGGIFQEEVDLILESGIDLKPIRYTMSVRRGIDKYVVVLIELEPVYQLMEDVSLYRKYAFTDSLTGALTRHGYWHELFELLRYAEKMDFNIGIIFVDIDDLKRMNSTYGYKGGDKQIAEVSKTISKTLRKSDLLIRLGGDEFLVLLPLRPNNKEFVRTIAKRIIRSVRSNPRMRTTVSLGTELVAPESISEVLKKRDIKKAWEAYIVEVDKKVKLAKVSGKNKVI